MKTKIQLLSLLLGIMLVGFSSCKTLKDGTLIIPTMSATIDGAAWASILRVSTVQKDVVAITGFPTAGKEKAILISIKGTGVQTYKLSATELMAQCAIIYQKTVGAAEGSSDYYVAINATVKITKYDAEKKLISGTFSGLLRPSDKPLAGTDLKIENGKFENISFQ